MKKHQKAALAALGILIFGVLALQAAEKDYAADISRIRTNLMDPVSWTPDGCNKTLIEVLDLSTAILPEKDYAAEFKTKVEWVRNMFTEGRMFSEKIRQYLGLSYMLVSNGAAWEVPQEMQKPYTGQAASLELAKKACAGYLDSALAELKAGNNEGAVRGLIAFVILIVTPIQA